MKQSDGVRPVRTVGNNGVIEWRDEHGKLHRTDGAAYEDPKANAKAWYIHGKLHREDGPAMDGPLGKSWYKNGQRHRVEGPAVEWADGRREWYRNGKEMTEDEYIAIREKELTALGEAFNTGLDHKTDVSHALSYKKR